MVSGGAIGAKGPPGSSIPLHTLREHLARRFDRHKRIARWTLPVWLYVSVTGVVVYWMLYQMRFA